MSKTKSDWVAPIPALPIFVRLPMQALFDTRLSSRELRVLSAIIAHADKSGSTLNHSPTLDRLAEMLGYFSNGKPHRPLLSKLVSSLEQKGWLKTHKHKGINSGQHYQLSIPSCVKAPQITNRSSPEYLAQAQEQRQIVAEAYNPKLGQFEDDEFFPSIDEEVTFAEIKLQASQVASGFEIKSALRHSRQAYKFFNIPYPFKDASPIEFEKTEELLFDEFGH